METPGIRPEPPLVVITGPTASGKTALAIELAEEYGGEIICADSRTVYRYMDIGTAKPSISDQDIVPHWGIDLVDPSDNFTAGDFKRYATDKIADIRRRGKIPFMVGGTGLYIDSVLFDYEFGAKSNLQFRLTLESLSLDQLRDYCLNNNIELPENKANKRYLIRAIEQGGINHRCNDSILRNAIVVGVSTTRKDLRERIDSRVEQLFANDVVGEANILGKKYGWASQAMTGNIYPILRRYIMHEIDIIEAKKLSVTSDYRLAKRQMTWFRRNSYVLWGTHKDIRDRVGKIITRY